MLFGRGWFGLGRNIGGTPSRDGLHRRENPWEKGKCGLLGAAEELRVAVARMFGKTWERVPKRFVTLLPGTRARLRCHSVPRKYSETLLRRCTVSRAYPS